MRHFPDNTISSFRNHYGEPIRIDNSFEVALVEYSYVHSAVLLDLGEVIGTCDDTGKLIKAQLPIFDAFEIADAIKSFVAWRAKKVKTNQENGYRDFSTSSAHLELNTIRKMGL